MPQQSFVYVIYIRTTPEKLWEALLSPEFGRRYWFGMHMDSGWTRGASWNLNYPDGKSADAGEILEIEPPTRLVLKWRNEWSPEMKADGDTRCTITLEPAGESVKLTVLHEAEKPHRLIDAVSGGWPQVFSSLKSLLETGDALPRPSPPCPDPRKGGGGGPALNAPAIDRTARLS